MDKIIIWVLFIGWVVWSWTWWHKRLDVLLRKSTEKLLEIACGVILIPGMIFIFLNRSGLPLIFPDSWFATSIVYAAYLALAWFFIVGILIILNQICQHS